jgi:nucleotide-binding universal stress UspA family protein
MQDVPRRNQLAPGPEAAHVVFRRVLCGVDTSPQGLEALRQADALQGESGSLAVVTAVDTAVSARGGWAATPAAAGLKAEAQAALAAAKDAVPHASYRLVEGRADHVLLVEAEGMQATLLAVGTHGFPRPIGIALASVTTVALHEAPCSVFVARGRPAGETLPRSIVVGIDGSLESAAAWAVARALADRLGVGARPVAARDGKRFDLSAVDLVAENVLVEDGDPVDVLVAATGRSDLLVVGSRGLHGLRALGSVSERVAHRAPCSVLVVRPPAP